MRYLFSSAASPVVDRVAERLVDAGLCSPGEWDLVEEFGCRRAVAGPEGVHVTLFHSGGEHFLLTLDGETDDPQDDLAPLLERVSEALREEGEFRPLAAPGSSPDGWTVRYVEGRGERRRVRLLRGVHREFAVLAPDLVREGDGSPPDV